MATVPLVMVSNDCAHEKKSPYGYLFNTEKTLYKEMNLQKEKNHLTVQNSAFLVTNICFSYNSNIRTFSFPSKSLNR